MKKNLRILYLEDSPEDVELVEAWLARENLACEVIWVDRREAFLSALKDAWNYDLLFADYSLPDLGGDEALYLARDRAPQLPFIFLAGSLGEERAVECLRRGATDYVLKTNLSRLAPVVRRALEEAKQAGLRREAEAASARVASLLRATLESTSEGILVVDLAGRISAYNRKFLSLFGIPEYVMAPMEMDQVIQYLSSQLGDPGALLEEARLLKTRPDRESSGLLSLAGGRVLEQTGRPHQLGSQTVGRVYSVRESPGPETGAEVLKNLGAGRTGFGEATLAARVVPWYLVEDRLVLPEGGQGVLGMSPLPGDLHALVELFHPEDADLFREALERGQNVSFSTRIRRTDGTYHPVRWNLDRSSEGYRGIVMDQEEPARFKVRQAHQERMEGAREAVRRLAGRIQEPLRAGLEGLKALAPSAPGLAGAARPLEELEDLLGRVRAFAQLGRPALAPVEPDAFLKGLLAELETVAGPEVHLEFCPAGNLPLVHLDPAQMAQALAALVLNARQAMKGAGRIQLATGMLAPRAYRPGATPGPRRTRVSFEVRDAGSGIHPGIQKRVCEPFFTTSPDPRQPGLGLTVVERIVLGHHGSLQFESEPGKGTTVRILLPV